MIAMFTLLGFSPNAAAELVNNSGLDSIEKLRHLKDSTTDEICRSLRRPGGTIPNPVIAAAVAVGIPPPANVPNMIPHPGFPAPALAIANMKVVHYIVKLKWRMSRPIAPAEITQQVLDNHRSMMEIDANRTDADKPKLGKKWTSNLRTIEEWLSSCYSPVTGNPLAYVIRAYMGVAPSANDPPANYKDRATEIIVRAPMFLLDAAGNAVMVGNRRQMEPYFEADNERVWTLLSDLLKYTDAWTYMQSFVRSKDGRNAWLTLAGHYRGERHVDNTAREAEYNLRSLVYYGERPRYTFHAYTRDHMDNHDVLERLRPHGYMGMDEGTKIRHFEDGIKCPKLRSGAMHTIRANLHLYRSFTAVAQFLQGAVTTENAASKRSGGRQVSFVETEDDSKSSAKVDVRYYTGEEYSELSPEQKFSLKRSREEMKGQSGKGKSSKKPGANQSNKSKQRGNQKFAKKQKRQISSMVNAGIKAALAKQKKTPSRDQDSSSDSDSDAPPPPKRANRSLSRRR